MNLKTSRIRAGLTQRDMAKKLNLNYNTYIAYEYGHRKPSKFAKEHIENAIARIEDRKSVSSRVARSLANPEGVSEGKGGWSRGAS